jgi:hypothetical protein
MRAIADAPEEDYGLRSNHHGTGGQQWDCVGASPEQIELANRAQKLRNERIERPAQIDSMAPTGNTDTPGGTEYNITLTISPVGGDSYQTTINQYIYPSNPFTEGESVTVRVDPDDVNVAMIYGHA